jgi:hypothetical protein
LVDPTAVASSQAAAPIPRPAVSLRSIALGMIKEKK